MPNYTSGQALAERRSLTGNQKRGYLRIKRIFDVLASIAAMIVLAVPMLLIALCVCLDSPGPAVYTQERIGERGKTFRIYKFRTMYKNADDLIRNFTPEQKAQWEKNFKLDEDPRITRVGRILRKSSMDELPQLLNIIKGELSLVGPRPVVAREVEKYGDDKELFLSVTPGLTGYWQAYARSNCTYEERIQMELDYAQNANLLWDIQIIFATVGSVLTGRGAK